MVVKGGDPYAQTVALEGRFQLIIMCDQENAVKNLVDMVRDSRTYETAVINTPKESMPKLDDRWSQGLWLGKRLASDEHNEGTSAGVDPSGGVQRISAGTERC